MVFMKDDSGSLIVPPHITSSCATGAYRVPVDFVLQPTELAYILQRVGKGTDVPVVDAAPHMHTFKNTLSLSSLHQG